MKLPLVIPSPSRRLLVLRVKIKEGKQRLAPLIDYIEQVCEPLFILTPYQADSRNEVYIIVSRACAHEAAEKLKSCGAVDSVDILENLPAREMFPLEVDGHRCVIYGETGLTALFAGIYKFLPPDTAMGILYHVGYYCGKELGIKLLSILKDESGEEIFRYYLEELFTLSGDGLVESIEVSNNRILVRVTDLIECSVQRKENLMFGSHFYRGLLAGLASGLLGGDFSAVEEACITRGALRCVFVLTRS